MRSLILRVLKLNEVIDTEDLKAQWGHWYRGFKSLIRSLIPSMWKLNEVINTEGFKAQWGWHRGFRSSMRYLTPRSLTSRLGIRSSAIDQIDCFLWSKIDSIFKNIESLSRSFLKINGVHSITSIFFNNRRDWFNHSRSFSKND